MLLSVWDNIVELSEKFKHFIIKYGDNPLFYAGLFMLGLLVFTVTYRKLEK